MRMPSFGFVSNALYLLVFGAQSELGAGVLIQTSPSQSRHNPAIIPPTVRPIPLKPETSPTHNDSLLRVVLRSFGKDAKRAKMQSFLVVGWRFSLCCLVLFVVCRQNLPKEPLAKVLPFMVRYLTPNGESAVYSPTPLFALSKVSKPVLSLSKVEKRV